MTRFVDRHPYELLALTALGVLLLWNLRSYWRGHIRLSGLHRRPQEYLPLAALAVETLKIIFRSC